MKEWSYRPVGEPGRRGPDLPVFVGAVTDHLGVDGAGNTVVKLGVQFGQGKGCVKENIYSQEMVQFKLQ